MVVGNTLGAAEPLRKYLESDSGSDLLARQANVRGGTIDRQERGYA